MSTVAAAPVSHRDMRFTIRNDSLRQTSQGYWIVDLAAARTGLQTYIDLDWPGGKRVEYRSFEEVSKPASLSTYEHSPVTIFHPQKGRVDLTNSPDVKRGYIWGYPRIERNAEDGEDYVIVTLVLDHPEAIDGVRTKRWVEASMGYDAGFDGVPGEYKGGRYDGSQTDISINHVALLPQGWARAGRFARIRVDSIEPYRALYAMTVHIDATPQQDGQTLNVSNEYSNNKGDSFMTTGTVAAVATAMLLVRLDAATTVPVDPAHAPTLENHLSRVNQQITDLTKQLDALTKERDGLQGKVDGLETQVGTLTTQLTDAKAKQTEGKEWANTFARAEKYLPESKRNLDSYATLREMRVDALAVLKPGVDFANASDERINTAFEVLTEQPSVTTTPVVGSGITTDSFKLLLDAVTKNAANMVEQNDANAEVTDGMTAEYQKYCNYLENAHKGGNQ